MWLADGLSSDGGIVAIVVAALGAIGAVATAWAKRGAEDDVTDQKVVAPAIEAAAKQGMDEAAAIYKDELMRERQEKDDVAAELVKVRTERDDLFRRLYDRGPQRPLPPSDERPE